MANFPAKSLSAPLRTSSFWGVVGLLVILGTSFTFALSNRAVAGDALYFLDLAAERTALGFVNDELARAKLYSSLSEERLGELEVVAARHEQALGTGNQEEMSVLRQQSVESYSLSLARVEVVAEYLQTKQEALPEGVTVKFHALVTELVVACVIATLLFSIPFGAQQRWEGLLIAFGLPWGWLFAGNYLLTRWRLIRMLKRVARAAQCDR